jgi:hypothetical protein
MAEARPTLYALAALYGALYVSTGLLILGGDVLRASLRANGSILGCVGVQGILKFAGRLPDDSFHGHIFIPRFGYVVVVNFMAAALAGLLGGAGPEKEKFDALFFGIAGLTSASLLARGFGTVSEFFVGSLFIGASFVAIVLMEHLIMPAVFFVQIQGQGGAEVLRVISSEHRVSVHALIRACRRWTPEDWSAFRWMAVGSAVVPIPLALVWFVILRVMG